MKKYLLAFFLIFLSGCEHSPDTESKASPKTQIFTKPKITWETGKYQTIKDIPIPEGYQAVTPQPETFAHFLQHFPLKPETDTVYLYNGQKKRNQSAQWAVLDIDTGDKDLQQCADAVMRLWAEYLFQAEKNDQIHFNFTSGDEARWDKYAQGYRASIKGNTVSWYQGAETDDSYENFRNYLNLVFTYAGSASLEKELQSVEKFDNIQIGDVIIQGGFPGHAVIVVNMAENAETGEKIFLLAQSYMPAQDIHILKNPSEKTLSPWYSTNFSGELHTPEWSFTKADLKRFEKITPP